MEKFVAIVFEDETQAYKGADALRGLHLSGDVEIKAAAVVAKTDAGEVFVKKTVSLGPVGTYLGIGAGAALGVMAGAAAVFFGLPIVSSAGLEEAIAGGLILGGMFGGVVGTLAEIDKAEVDASALQEVAGLLEPGKTCVVASVFEAWDVPLDNRMAELNGAVFRKGRHVTTEEYFRARSEALNAQIDDLEEDLRRAHGENRDAVETGIATAKSKLQDINDKLAARVRQANDRIEAGLTDLDERLDAGVGAPLDKMAVIAHRAELNTPMETRTWIPKYL